MSKEMVYQCDLCHAAYRGAALADKAMIGVEVVTGGNIAKSGIDGNCTTAHICIVCLKNLRTIIKDVLE